jgi:hypothetical protein
MVAFGRRIRKGTAGTVVAAAAMAALTASQAPGLAMGATHPVSHDVQPGPQIDGGSPDYFTALPPLSASPAPGTQKSGTSTPVVTGPDTAGIPATVLAAYQHAQSVLAGTRPGCNLPWQLLAAIGQVESGQAEGGAVNLAGTADRKILGPVLNGNGYADITDTDGGRYDGDSVHDRAVGPMQFIPSTWRTWGADGNGDGVADPENVFDAALAAGNYLCAVGGDLSQTASVQRAILGYNHSDAYLHTVMSWFDYFRHHADSVPDSTVGGGVTATGGGVTAKPTPSGSPTPSASPSPSRSAHPSPSASASPSGTPSASPSPSASGTGSASPSPSTSASGSPSPSTSPTGCPTPSGSATPTPTASDSPSPSPSDSCSPSPTPSVSESPSPSESASPSEGATVTP